jgi:hypothetical protein
MKLFMTIIGCRPAGRLTEQHDVFFGLGEQLADLVPQINAFWPEVKGKFHIDSWREVSKVGDYAITVVNQSGTNHKELGLFFFNLGGYLPQEMEEFHYKKLVVAPNLAVAQQEIKKSEFYKNYDFPGAVSHIDDKYGLDIDEYYNVSELIRAEDKLCYGLQMTIAPKDHPEDELHIGYLPLKNISK